MNLRGTKKSPSWEREASVWRRVQQNGEKKERRYVFKVQLFPLSAEAETTTGRNKESVLLDNGEKEEEGGSLLSCGGVLQCQPGVLRSILYLQVIIYYFEHFIRFCVNIDTVYRELQVAFNGF